MNILVTGCAGFIGYHVACKFCSLDHRVFGLDSMNDYYDVNLKSARLAQLNKNENFHFVKNELLDYKWLTHFIESNNIKIIVHLAAQAGVRHSIKEPMTYVKNNLEAFTNILEAARHTRISNFLYASTSSVYGLNSAQPFSEKQSTNHPIQFYAATKKANELMAHSYSHLFDLPTIGLRFFTVYGPWGRPDMALFKFTERIMNDQPIQIFNNGNHVRDFTYVEDVAESIYRLACKPPTGCLNFEAKDPDPSSSVAPYRVFNVGNSSPVPLLNYVKQIEICLGKTAQIEFLPLQQGDVPTTSADTSALAAYINYVPQVKIEEGIKKFVQWFKEYYQA